MPEAPLLLWIPWLYKGDRIECRNKEASGGLSEENSLIEPKGLEVKKLSTRLSVSNKGTELTAPIIEERKVSCLFIRLISKRG